MSTDLAVLLGQFPDFRGASPALLSKLAQQGQIRRALARDEIYGPGDCSSVFIVHMGRLRLTHAIPDGNIFLALCRPGDMVGIEHLWDDSPRTRSVALDASSVMAFPTEAVRDLAAEFPELSGRHNSQLYRSHKVVLERLDDMVRFNVPQRLYRFLIHLAECYGNQRNDGAILIDCGLSHQDMASSVGTSRETATTLLNGLKGEGLLNIGRKTVTILDLDALRKRAQ